MWNLMTESWTEKKEVDQLDLNFWDKGLEHQLVGFVNSYVLGLLEKGKRFDPREKEDNVICEICSTDITWLSKCPECKERI